MVNIFISILLKYEVTCPKHLEAQDFATKQHIVHLVYNEDSKGSKNACKTKMLKIWIISM